MTSDISIGTISQTGSSARITGTISGFDTDALVENAVNANNAEADQIDIRIQENQAEIDAYQEFFGLSNNLQTALSALRSDTSAAESTSAFDQRTANLTSSGAEATGLINVSLDESTPQGQYQIVVEQKAEPFSIGSSVFSNSDGQLGSIGDFDIGLEGFSTVNITTQSTDTLQDIADKINAESNVSGASASILQVSETGFQLILSGVQENATLSVSTNSGNTLQNLGLVDALDIYDPAQVIQLPQGSQVTLDGTIITRDDNVYDDLIDGISFNVLAADAGSTITIDVNNDVAAVKAEIEAFVEAYNAFRDFVIQNQQINEDGTIPDDAVLFGDNLLTTLSNDVFDVLNSFNGDNGNVTNLADLGITLDDNNRLLISNVAALDDALLNDFADIQNFFSTGFTIDNANLGVISNTSTQESLAFDLQIALNPDDTIASAVADGVAFQVNGSSLIGPPGTIYEGLTFAYIGSTNATISVSIEAGIADALFSRLEGYVSPTNGIIQTQIDALTSTNEDLSEEASDIRAQGEEIREQEIARYATLEAQLLRLETLRSTLNALLGNNDDN